MQRSRFIVYLLPHTVQRESQEEAGPNFFFDQRLLIQLIANRRDSRTEDPLQRDDPLPGPGGRAGSVWGARRWRNISWSPSEIM